MPSDLLEQPPTTGVVAGKYELLRLIGRGGMGTVWEGKHATLGTRVAIKFIDVEYADSQEARTRFDNEARAAATIQSKHAIQIYDHGVTDDGKPYIVMELLTGEPLDQRIERTGRLSLQDTARILRQVARALGRAHERGIVHRDLKPENIFLVRTPDEDDEIAKVLDFGIAKFKRPDQGGGVSSSTKTGAVLGTPFYMSPEQARGLREIDHRTDLWSLGIIAFKCVAGVLPFEGVSVGDLLVKICTSAPPVPSQVVPGLPSSFDAWFARALERDPARRFQSAQELADALAYAAGVSVRKQGSAMPPSYDSASGSGPQPQLSMRSSAPTPIPMRGSGAAGAAVTSAPFTASAAGLPTGGRGVLYTAIGAAVVGMALGVFLIMKLAGPSKHPGNLPSIASTVNVGTMNAGSSANGSNGSTGATPLTTLMPMAPTTGVAPLATSPSGKDAGVIAIVDVPAGIATLTNPPPTPPGRGPKRPIGKPPSLPPGPSGPAIVTQPPAPVTQPSAPVTQEKPVTKPAPTVIDPGY